ncbi:hypothetical protein MDAP_001764 [Mitosporidium daphniae]
MSSLATVHPHPEQSPQAAFNKLLEIEGSLDSIDTQRSIEIANIFANYDEKKLPFLQKRDAIIKAEIPAFWSIAFRNHPVLGTLLEEEDIAVFSYLSSITVEKISSSGEGKRIIFTFNANPYFSNATLVKEINEEEGTKNYPIDWLPGMNLIEPTQGNQKRRHTATASFFAWFSDEDREVADIIATELYPNAIKYYSGEYSQEEIDDDDEDLEEDEDEDEGENEEDEEEEDSEGEE